MLTHKKLILLFLIIILSIVLILQCNKKTNDNIKSFQSLKDPKFVESIYALNRNRDEKCGAGESKMDITKKRDNSKF